MVKKNKVEPIFGAAVIYTIRWCKIIETFDTRDEPYNLLRLSVKYFALTRSKFFNTI